MCELAFQLQADHSLSSRQRLLKNVIPASQQGAEHRRMWVCSRTRATLWITLTHSSTVSGSL